ncbi:MAG: endopeptidase La [Spirochaetales bacterium]|nr:endopeptidase La [Spirochaetales bacterium]
MSLIDSLKAHGESVELPLVYARESVIFPRSLAPILVATSFGVNAAELAMKGDRRVAAALLARMPDEKSPDIEVAKTATICHIIQFARLPDGTARLLVEGERRARVRKTVYRKDHLSASLEPFDDGEPERDHELEALMEVVRKDFLQYAELAKKIPPELVQAVVKAEGPHRLVDLAGHALAIKAERKQDLLDAAEPRERLELLAASLEAEVESLSLQKRISQRVKSRIDKSQRDYFLNEQLREINRELGKESGDESETKELERRILERQPPAEVLEKARKELGRLSKLQAFSPEAGVLRAYCEWIADLPWSGKTSENRDIALARAALDEDHYGMEKAKERILEYIAVLGLKEKLRGPILCFVGAPGTGKTSLGRSVARALGREFVRVSLGGVRDEAEIRGHRKTYVGALPGKILQSMKKAGVSNPVFLLDEVDKLSSDFRGDPASALLEVLDPEQNHNFTDHYLELPYDLSSTLFIATANSLHSIPAPLLDRMEVIEIPGYSEYEKLEIAKSFIVPRQLEENGLGSAKVRVSDDAILEIIRHYTMESGVRSLEREIAHVVRRVAREAVEKGWASGPGRIDAFARSISSKTVAALLGKPRRQDDPVYREGRIGVAYGLAWTELGGTVLPVESTVFEGEESLILTGKLGDVMKESARAALSLIRARAETFGLDADSFRKKTLHVHVPEGAIPKDGPSAGITLAASMLSALSGKPLLAGRAMTGEITLTGRILPIGGLKEKVLAARRLDIGTVLLPARNVRDLEDVPREVARELEFILVETVDEALAALFPSGSFPGAGKPAT